MGINYLPSDFVLREKEVTDDNALLEFRAGNLFFHRDVLYRIVKLNYLYELRMPEEVGYIPFMETVDSDEHGDLSTLLKPLVDGKSTLVDFLNVLKPIFPTDQLELKNGVLVTKGNNYQSDAPVYISQTVSCSRKASGED